MPLLATYVTPHPPLIIPDIGKGAELTIQKTIDAYREIAKRIAELKPETIIVTSPHSAFYSNYLQISKGDRAKGDFGRFGSLKTAMEIDYDQELAVLIETIAQKHNIPAGTEGEQEVQLDHGTMVPLFFINQQYNSYKLVRISISGLSFEDHLEFGKAIDEAIEKSGKKVILVASGDLSHRLKEDGPYGLSEAGPIFDKQVIEALSKGDLESLVKLDESFCEEAGECGLRSLIIMAGALEGKKFTPQMLSYEGPFGVGYAVAAFEIRNVEEDPYVKLARESLETYIKTGKRLVCPQGLPDELTKKKAGVFVSLKIDGELRGCIGTIAPTTTSIANEIIRNAVSSGVEDPRFEPVNEEELPLLTYSVDILGESEAVATIEDLDAGRYGVIVSSYGRRGLLLPNLEGIDTPQQQLEIALRKAGIFPGEDFSIERFEVIRHK